MNNDYKTRHGVLHTPESYPGIQYKLYHVLCDPETLVFVVCLAQRDMPLDQLTRECGLDHVVTIRAKDEVEAEARKDDIEAWHKGLTRYEH